MGRINVPTFTKETSWDMIVIGGGATGLGIALDAVTRGLKVLLLERFDLAKGTSSRSTKLVHGGVRYLAQGNINLVRHALIERGFLKANAPNLVHSLGFVIPCYTWFSAAKYLMGLKIYDCLSGKYSFGTSQFLSQEQVMEALPGVKKKGLKGGVLYFDGKFDDARLALALAKTAQKHGAEILTYTKVTNLIKDPLNQKVLGVIAIDQIEGTEHKFLAKVVINATGVFVDNILQMHTPNLPKSIKPSQGVHLVFDKKFLPSKRALMIPKTTDGRVLFAIPWYDYLLVGTTDTPINHADIEPSALTEEIDFILKNARHYLDYQPTHNDILCVFSGLRPLVVSSNNSEKTKEISRDHKMFYSAPGLITIIGGKWTTYRKMAQDTVNFALNKMKIKAKDCRTKDLLLESAFLDGCTHQFEVLNGTDEIQSIINSNPSFEERIYPEYPYSKALIVWVIRNELVETIEDILARRLRLLFTNPKMAINLSDGVAQLLAQEKNETLQWAKQQSDAFKELAFNYLYKKKGFPQT